MRVLTVHNFHRTFGGADMVPLRTRALLEEAGEETALFSRDSKELKGIRGHWSAFRGGFYPAATLAEFRRFLDRWRPDVVHGHDVYPLISPWVFKICRERGIPAVLTCHDYRMTCPVSTHLREGRTCLDCLEKGLRMCLLRNCRRNLCESLAYAGRNAWARQRRLFDGVGLFLTPSEFTRRWLVDRGGLASDRVMTVGNPVTVPADPPAYEPERRSYIAYAGRFSPEKGVEGLIRAAARAGWELRLAGDRGGWQPPVSGPGIRFLGELRNRRYDEFLDGAKILAVPSVCFESFGLTAAEAMARGVPVVVSRTGALEELVRDGENGLLCRPGDDKALEAALGRLWNDHGLARRLSAAGRETVRRFVPETYLGRIREAYRRARDLHRRTAAPGESPAHPPGAPSSSLD